MTAISPHPGDPPEADVPSDVAVEVDVHSDGAVQAQGGDTARARQPIGCRAPPAGRGQPVWMEVSSITKLVCSEASSVPVNLSVTLLPAYADRSKVRCW